MNRDKNEKPRGLRSRLLAASSAAAILLLGLGASALLPRPAVETTSAQEQQPARLEQVAERNVPPHMLEAGAPFSFADLVERVSPAVVTVTVEQEINAAAGMNPQDLPEPFRDFFNQYGQQQGKPFNIPRKAVAMGSGFIIDKAGYIVTNNHVVESAKVIKVKLPDGREFNARLIGADPATDVALLKIVSDRLPSVDFGDDRQVRVGDWVVAVGNPFGLSNTVTAGIVSSIGRDVGNGPYTNFIQIDAPSNRGNSGGPTFDTRGRVIGMNSMIFSPTGGSVGIGFAIPASTIRDVISQLKAHGRVARGWLGVEVQ